jgi:hypothetical protein
MRGKEACIPVPADTPVPEEDLEAMKHQGFHSPLSVRLESRHPIGPRRLDLATPLPTIRVGIRNKLHLGTHDRRTRFIKDGKRCRRLQGLVNRVWDAARQDQAEGCWDAPEKSSHGFKHHHPHLQQGIADRLALEAARHNKRNSSEKEESTDTREFETCQTSPTTFN